VGVLAPPAIAGTRLWDESLEKTETYRTFRHPGREGVRRWAQQRGNPVAEREMLPGLEACPNNLDTLARFGRPAPAKVLVFMQLFRLPPHYVMRCGAIDLVTPYPRRLRSLQIGNGGPAAREDLMTWKFPAANRLAVLLAASAVVAVSFDITPASAQTSRQFDDRGRPYYGPGGPNVSYQQGPRTRIYVTKRSWLDAGTEVLPGERKFTDYAYPPELGYPSFARENKNRPIDRQPLNPPSDMGGYPQTFPLY
jgi:hypothetical protein